MHLLHQNPVQLTCTCLPASSPALNRCVALPRLPCCTAAGITGGLVALYFVLLLWMTCWIKVEAFFENTPWLRCGGRRQGNHRQALALLHG